MYDVVAPSLDSKFQNLLTMAKYNSRTKTVSFLFAAGSLAALLVVWAFCSFSSPTRPKNHSFSTSSFSDQTFTQSHTSDSYAAQSLRCTNGESGHTITNLPGPNFYDDPKLSYTIDTPPVKNWDKKRAEWLKQHPSFTGDGGRERVLMVTGSQATPCKNPIGDYLLLKFFKNKVDYARRHDIDVFYNNVLFHPKMFSFWAKTPTVKAVMLAHPEVEWIWWVDSDAAFTDMDFELPLDRYKAHDLVIHGWPHLIYENRSWTSINAGVFLIRNSQWAMDFMDVWASMGPQAKDYDKWSRIQKKTFKDKVFSESDDQSGLVYLLLKEKDKWGDRIYLESEYYFEGYWMDFLGTYDYITDEYKRVEKGVTGLRRRHAEKVSKVYARMWQEHLKGAGYGRGSWRRPFITHFTGCQPCSGNHNEMYSGRACVEAMEKALVFADNQVIRNYGFVHPDLGDHSTVNPLPFDYPVARVTEFDPLQR